MNDPLTRAAVAWAAATLGPEDTFSQKRRVLRLLEEAIELAQASQLPRNLVQKLVDTVFDRPHGQAELEMGGVALTFTVLCGIQGCDPSDYAITELVRVLGKPAEGFRKRLQEKIDQGLVPPPVPDPYKEPELAAKQLKDLDYWPKDPT